MHQRLKAVNACGAVVETGNHAIGFTACFHEDLFTLLLDLFEGFEAVTEKGGAEHGKALDAFTRHGAQGFVGIGFEPLVKLVGAEARLERHAPAVVRQSSGLHDSACGGKALLAIADSMGIGVGYVAAVVTFHAVFAGGIGFLQMPLRNTMITKEDVLITLF